MLFTSCDWPRGFPEVQLIFGGAFGGSKVEESFVLINEKLLCTENTEVTTAVSRSCRVTAKGEAIKSAYLKCN